MHMFYNIAHERLFNFMKWYVYNVIACLLYFVGYAYK